MNTTIKYSIIALVLIAIIFFLYKKNTQNKVCYNLSPSINPDEFGPSYWNAFHDLSNRIPCGLCKPFAQKFITFFHDVVNKKLGKPIFDQNNYNEILAYLNTPVVPQTT